MSFSLVPRLEWRSGDAAKVASLVLILGERVIATQPWGRAALFLLSGTAMVIALSRSGGAPEPSPFQGAVGAVASAAKGDEPPRLTLEASLRLLRVRASAGKIHAGVRALLRSRPSRS